MRGWALWGAGLAALVAAPAPAQDSGAVELTEPIRREADHFEMRLPKDGADQPTGRGQSKISWAVRTAGGGWITVDLAEGVTPVAWATNWRDRGYGPGYTIESVRLVRDDASLSDAMLRAANATHASVDECYFIAGPGRCYCVLFRFRSAEAAAWAGIARDVLASFRVLDAPPPPPTLPPAPVLAEAAAEARADLGCRPPVPKGAAPATTLPGWMAAQWDYPLAGDAAGSIGLAFSEPHEPWPAFLQALIRAHEGDGWFPTLDLRGAKAPEGSDAVLAFTRGGTVQRCVCLRRDGFGAAAIFTYRPTAEKLWLPFAAEWCKTLAWTGTPTALRPRRPDHEPGALAVYPDRQIEFRVPVGVESRGELKGRDLHVWDLEDSSGRYATFYVFEGHGGEGGAPEGVDDLIEAIKMGHAATVELLDKAGDPVRGTAAYLRLGRATTDDRFQFWFCRRGIRSFGWAVRHAPAQTDEWGRIMDRILLSFRVQGAPDARFAPPERATDETIGEWRCKVEPGLPRRAVAAVVADLDVGVALARQLARGPEVRPPRTVHCFLKPERLQLVVPSGDLDTPTALYCPQERLFLAHLLPRHRRPAKGSGDRYAAGLRAYLDAWLGTPFGLSPWLEAGLTEAALTAKTERGGVTCDWRRSELAATFGKKGQKPVWPDCAEFLRRRTALTTDAERAYALALVLTLVEGKAPGWDAVIPRYFAHLKRRGLPAEALDVALDGVDPAALDAAARKVLGG